MKKSIWLVATSLMCSTSVFAKELTLSLTNLTQGIYFTPVLSAAHNEEQMLFKLGQAASPQLQAMAEGGDISALASMLLAASADVNQNPAAGLLAPSGSVSYTLNTSEGNDYLSLVAMLLPTNDGFVALNHYPIPTEAGTYEVMLNAYDAGTEANNELVVEGSGAPNTLGIPASPNGSGQNGTGMVLNEANTTVHIHPGNLGDDNENGGQSDLNNQVHRWLNPVAKLTITVK